jgi:NAD(P)-dependent dehydrogenase (short-subunit alcohol dehydrogenase family)
MTPQHIEGHDVALADRIFVVTGANSGIGFETTRALARSGAHVILACRSETRAKQAISRITAEQPSALLEFVPLDLASLASIEDCATRLYDRLDRLDVLCHNAGVMALPRTLTRDGFEMQFGVNHLGHFALAGRLLRLLLAAPAPRIVQVGSNAHVFGRIDLDDLQGERRYGKWRAYANSKLANLLYFHELRRRLDAGSGRLKALGAHPGYAATDLLMSRDGASEPTLRERVVSFGNRLLAQSAADGAAPTVRAATDDRARNGDYFGPDGFLGLWGAPTLVKLSARASDPVMAGALWQRSVELTGIDYAALEG